MQKRSNEAGYNWLSGAYGVKPVQPFRITSLIGKGRVARSNNGFVVNTYSPTYEPEPSLRGHLVFALKYEGVDLDFLGRLFAVTGAAPILEWIRDEPLGKYARRCGFLYEWLTGMELQGVGDAGGNYVDLLNSERYLVATKPEKVRRWRINNNLPGTRDFCPMVLAADVSSVEPEALRGEIDRLIREYGCRAIERAADWLTIKESRASFVIESEGQEEARIHRLANVMRDQGGQIKSALSDEGVLDVQRAVMGDKLVGARLGARQSPVFVGHTSSGGKPTIDYLAPHHDDVPKMMAGLRAYEERTRGQNPLLRAAALSFGFVYIHPLGDGNGRLSRFLINDLLRRDGFLPAPIVLPISAVVGENLVSRQQYDAALERLSRPLMEAIRELCEFGAMVEYPDGVKSNLHVADWGRASGTWRYADLTYQAHYLIGVIEASIIHELKDEVQHIRRYYAALESLKEAIEARDEDYGQIIHSISKEKGVSSELRKTYPAIFEDPRLAARIERGILSAFEDLGCAEEDLASIEPRFTVKPRSE